MIRLDLRPLDDDPAARQALALIWPVLPQARLVGGVVRDLAAGVAAADLDLGTPEPPQTVIDRLTAAGIRSIATGLAHGTVTALAAGRPVEITSLRRDERTDGRHAVVAWTEDWREDAQRRDFTINAMSLAADGSLFDYFGGLNDLRAGRVRFVGDAAARIVEDGLRILRFFRFDARYRSGEPDADAVRAIGEALPRLDLLSPERVWSELRRVLVGPRLGETLSLMRRLGVLGRVLPGADGPGREHRAALVPADPILRLATLIDGPPAPAAHALRLSNRDAARLAALLGGPAPRPGLDEASLRRLLADAPADLLRDRAWLAEAEAMDGDPDRGSWCRLRARIDATTRPVFALSGGDLLARGLPPGPRVGALLAAMRAWWIAGGCVADRAACLAEIDRLCAAPAPILPPEGPAC